MSPDLPHGCIACRFKQRRMLTAVKGCPAEVVFEVESGPCKGQRITTRIWSRGLITRAGQLSFDEQVLVYLAPVRPSQRHGYRRVIDFHDIQRPPVGEMSGVDAEPRSRGAVEAPSGIYGLRPHLAAKVMETFLNGVDVFDESDSDEDAILTDDIDLFARVLNALCAPDGVTPDERDEEEDFDLEDYASTFHVQFLVVNGKKGHRTPEKWEPLLTAYASADPSRRLHAEAHISVYQYTPDAISYQSSNKGSVAGYCGIVWSRWLTMELDGDGGLEDTLSTARTIVAALYRLGIPRDSLHIFFSGNRGIHIQFPSTVAGATPQVGFERVAGYFCQLIADLAVLAHRHAHYGEAQSDTPFAPARLDQGMYSRNAMLRAPNTAHPDTGLFKVRLTPEELMGIHAEQIRDLAKKPRPFVLPPWQHPARGLLSDCWEHAVRAEKRSANRLETVSRGGRHIFNDTLAFLHHGAPEGTRTKWLFRAAVNLLEFRCPVPLLLALLGPPAEISGLTSEEIHEQIRGAVRYHEKHVLPRMEDDDDDDWD